MCKSNSITSLAPITNLTNLKYVDYRHNPIEYIPPNILRILNQIKNHQDIYNDTQNVHNHNIQDCIKKSIQNILNCKPLFTDINNYILNDDIFTNQTKRILIEYAECTDIHSTLNITFEELLIHVLNQCY